MNDGSSGNGFGDALENMTTQSAKALGGTITDFKNSAKGQLKVGGGISGSFTPGSSNQQQQNPNSAPGLSGGDLFSPDMLAGKPNKSPNGQNPTDPKPLTAAGQQLAQNPDVKSPEEVAKIQNIEQELRSMHQKYYQDFVAKAEGRDRKTVEEKQNKDQEEQKKQMVDLQKKEDKKVQDASLLRAKQGVENKGGGAG
jgi:hypothetical protein